jgi:hypothetical protein
MSKDIIIGHEPWLRKLVKLNGFPMYDNLLISGKDSKDKTDMIDRIIENIISDKNRFVLLVTESPHKFKTHKHEKNFIIDPISRINVFVGLRKYDEILKKHQTQQVFIIIDTVGLKNDFDIQHLYDIAKPLIHRELNPHIIVSTETTDDIGLFYLHLFQLKVFLGDIDELEFNRLSAFLKNEENKSKFKFKTNMGLIIDHKKFTEFVSL